MSKSLSLTRKTTTIFLPLLSFATFLLLLLLLKTQYHKILEWAALYNPLSIWALLGVVIVIGLGLVAAARATMVTWITVLVLLTFAGNRRRVLVKRGKTITNDVALLLLGVLVKERGFVVACATVFSLMAVIGIREAHLYFFVEISKLV